MIGYSWHLVNTGYTIAAVTAFLLLAVCLWTNHKTHILSSDIILQGWYRDQKCTWKYFRKKALIYNKMDVNIYSLKCLNLLEK